MVYLKLDEISLSPQKTRNPTSVHLSVPNSSFVLVFLMLVWRWAFLCMLWEGLGFGVLFHFSAYPVPSDNDGLVHKLSQHCAWYQFPKHALFCQVSKFVRASNCTK